MLAGALALVSAAGPASGAQESKITEIVKAVGFDQRLESQIPLDLSFKDETGATVRLDAYMPKGGKKPVALVFVYYQCPMLCTQVLNEFTTSLKTVGLKPGDDFEILTVSIDPRETPDLAARKKQSYIESLGRPEAAKGWHFLTGDEESIKRITDAAGFRFTWDEDTQQYAHPGGLVILTPEGRVSRYLFDVVFSSRDMRFGLIEAARGEIGSLVDRVALFLCYHYDPASGKYGLVITNVIRILCFLTVAGIGTFIFVMLRRDGRLAAQGSPTT
jgi:protein SCO1/2